MGHGKDEVDEARALLKREIRKGKIEPTRRKIQNVAKIVAFLRFEAKKFHVTY